MASRVTYLEDAAAVAAAVVTDPRSVGLASTLAPAPLLENPPGRPVPVPILVTPDGPPVIFTIENVAAGTYPLWHHVYVCCRAGGGSQGVKFVTYATGDRGQRQIAGQGFLPVHLVLREVQLTRKPVGN